MSLISRLLPDYELLGIAKDYREVVLRQKALIETLQREKLELTLSQARWCRTVIENFLIALDNPEMEVRDILIDALKDFQDEVARLEEHVS